MERQIAVLSFYLPKLRRVSERLSSQLAGNAVSLVRRLQDKNFLRPFKNRGQNVLFVFRPFAANFALQMFSSGEEIIKINLKFLRIFRRNFYFTPKFFRLSPAGRGGIPPLSSVFFLQAEVPPKLNILCLFWPSFAGRRPKRPSRRASLQGF